MFALVSERLELYGHDIVIKPWEVWGLNCIKEIGEIFPAKKGDSEMESKPEQIGWSHWAQISSKWNKFGVKPNIEKKKLNK